MNIARNTLLITLVVLFAVAPAVVLAQGACVFGNFEMPFLSDIFPDGYSGCIDNYASSGTPIISFFNIVVIIITVAIVATAMILIVIGGYVYMTAGGSAERVGLAKRIIVGALSGILLAMTAWLILNTISPQFTSKLEEPTIKPPEDLLP